MPEMLTYFKTSICFDCKEEQSSSEFNVNNEYSSRTCSSCRKVFKELIELAEPFRKWNREEIRWRKILNIYGIRCTYCKRFVGRPGSKHGSDWEANLDHVYPKLLGGSNAVWNRQMLCGKCNRDKGCSTEKEYIERLKYRDLPF